MIKVGLAETYRCKPLRGFDARLSKAAEATAKKSKLGMWGLGDRYMSPNEWRKRHK
jgi:endonuclease YncB( thermonuclease family)